MLELTKKLNELDLNNLKEVSFDHGTGSEFLTLKNAFNYFINNIIDKNEQVKKSVIDVKDKNKKLLAYQNKLEG